ncbi:hypothetical protein CRYUN_Cryun05aG0037900 [Craigia yunnanensis]
MAGHTPRWIHIVIQNNTGIELKRQGGPEPAPETIPPHQTVESTMDTSSGSIGTLLYEQNGVKWIIAWSNVPNVPNKAYTKIVGVGENHPIYKEISNHLENGINTSNDREADLSASVVIDNNRTIDKPTLKAVLEPYAQSDTLQVGSIIPLWWTRSVIQNNTDSELKKLHLNNQLVFKKPDGAPDTIQAYRTVEFKDYGGNSIEGVLYQIENKGAIWIILWQVLNVNNQVLTKILDINPGEGISWKDITTSLGKASNTSFDHNAGLWAYAVIDKTGFQTTLTAILTPSPLSDTPQVGSIIPLWWTRSVIQNNTDNELKKFHLSNQLVFKKPDGAPDTIQAYRTVEFKDCGGNSIEGVLYQVENKGAIWIILWQVLNVNNQVLTKILDINPGEGISWKDITTSLEKASNTSSDHNAGLWAYAVIDKTGFQTTLTAILTPSPL